MYKVIDALPDEEELPSSPSELWLILTLEVVVRDGFGDYLLVIYPSYPFATASRTEGYWAPPFVGYPVKTDFTTPETVGGVRRLFEQELEDLDAERSVEQLAYLHGFAGCELGYAGSFTEVKKSPRRPNLVKCYKITRYRLKKIGSSSLRNIADPECRKGYVFLPLSPSGDEFKRRESPEHGRKELTYLSKPIMSNLEWIMESGRVADLRSDAIELDPRHFYRSKEGVLIAVDLAGYGRTCAYAKKHMQSFDQRGQEIARSFRDSVASEFYAFLCRAGLAEVHMAGDGFIAALPTGGLPVDEIDVSPVLEEYARLLGRLQILNGYIKDPNSKVGSRLAAHFGKYRYGRIAQGRSFSPDFDGASIIETARLEQGLREALRDEAWLKSLGENAAPLREEGPAHVIACSAAVKPSLEKALRKRSDVQGIGSFSRGLKEAQLAADVFIIDPAPPS